MFQDPRTGESKHIPLHHDAVINVGKIKAFLPSLSSPFGWYERKRSKNRSLRMVRENCGESVKNILACPIRVAGAFQRVM